MSALIWPMAELLLMIWAQQWLKVNITSHHPTTYLTLKDLWWTPALRGTAFTVTGSSRQSVRIAVMPPEVWCDHLCRTSASHGAYDHYRAQRIGAYMVFRVRLYIYLYLYTGGAYGAFRVPEGAYSSFCVRVLWCVRQRNAFRILATMGVIKSSHGWSA